MSDLICDIHQGDCRDVLKTLPENSVHCVVTSPPYWGLRDYGVDGQIGLEKSVDEFITTMVEVFREVRRVLRPDGTVWMNLGDTYAGSNAGRGDTNPSYKNTPTHLKRPAPANGLKPKDLIGIPWRVALALQADGWWLRSDIIWHKPNPVPEPLNRGRPTVAHEYLFLLTKSAQYYYDAFAITEKNGDEPDWETYENSLGSNTGADALRWAKGYKKTSHNQKHPAGRNKRTVWRIGTKGIPQNLKQNMKAAGIETDHFATFPPALVEPCVLAGTSEKGCCPQCGTPWNRITKPTEEYAKHLGGWHDHNDDIGRGQRGTPPAVEGEAYETTGWEPGCPCNAGDAIPCIVLDPFGGSGTVGEVANRLGRNTVLIELNPAYIEIIKRRVDGVGHQKQLF